MRAGTGHGTYQFVTNKRITEQIHLDAVHTRRVVRMMSVFSKERHKLVQEMHDMFWQDLGGLHIVVTLRSSRIIFQKS
ncbi:hypothetical protein SERLA73DRAFT_174741 [Serpula lacrymans var. lacrymans S7.3]|uniref:Uncharacterized protein n=1 Tax=Serpula lacrymans var. lacrymans (strain S7.3) TaxID=936435 RepID=F8PKH0_SERL3|nr:hypothetical protein SERLA73DRAFT_174741 [Serpula lacrymans var. lacrymans S7.3]